MAMVAFQGGGARLVELLATASAIRDSRFPITALAGTSAGSIAAAVLAAGKDPEALRQYFLTHQKRHRKLVTVGSPLWKAFQVARGRPLVRTNVLKGVINEAFDALEISRNLKIGDLETPLSIVAADLRSKEKKIFDKGDNLIDSVVKSCSVPLLFSSFGDTDSFLVDGGLLSNLPVDALLEQENDDDTIAVCFGNTFQFEPTSALEYISEMFSALIDSSVIDSKLRVGSDNLYEINTHIRSFNVNDFYSGLERDFGVSKKRALDWLERWKSRRNVHFDDFNTRHVHPPLYLRYLFDKVDRLVDISFNPQIRRIGRLSIELETSINDAEDGYDAVHSDFQLMAHPTEPLTCYVAFTTVGGQDSEFISADWRVSDEAGNEIDHVAIPMQRRGEHQAKIAIFFGKPLAPDPERKRYYRVLQRQIIRHLMPELEKHKSDYYKISVSPNETIDQAELILATKKGAGRIVQRGETYSKGAPVIEDRLDSSRSRLIWRANDLKGGDVVHVIYTPVR